MSDLRVLVVGSGLGGLALAQSLRKHGIDVALFERDAGPWDRPQGYRLHLDADARNAARDVLPAHLDAVFEATSQVTEPFTTILGTDLSVIKRLPTDDEHDPRIWPDDGHRAGHANVDRATLRQILLGGLDEVVHFGKALESFDETADGVTAHFTDGSAAHGDVLVGADGIGSVVRRTRGPGGGTVDAGISAVYGRIPLPAAASLVPEEALQDIFAIAADRRKVFLGLGAVRFPTSPARAAARHAPRMAMREQEDYVVCIAGGRHEFFPALAGAPRRRSGDELRAIATDALAGWPPAAAAVLAAADASSLFAVEMRTSVPVRLGAPGRVTLLGDAAHAMTPTLGRGANLAMRDGALLGRALAGVADDRVGLSTALADYERDMLRHGFSVVTEAARIGHERMGQNVLPV